LEDGATDTAPASKNRAAAQVTSLQKPRTVSISNNRIAKREKKKKQDKQGEKLDASMMFSQGQAWKRYVAHSVSGKAEKSKEQGRRKQWR
jgi:hypothetical protein